MAIRTLLMITALLFVGGASGMSHASGKTTTFDFMKGFSNKAEDQVLSVADGDEIEFTWTGGHNVYLMKDKTAFDSCLWDGSTLIGDTSGAKRVISGSDGTVQYFACKVGSHCTSGQKLAVTIGATTAGADGHDHSHEDATASLAVRSTVSSLSALVVALVTLLSM